MCLTLLGSAIFLYGLARLLLLNSYEDLEYDNTLDNLERGVNAIESNISAMDSGITDWAYWDDTYYYLLDGNDTFIRNNIYDTVYEGLDLDMMLFFNREGELVFAEGFNQEAFEITPIPDDLLEVLQADQNLLLQSDLNSGTSGIRLTPYGALALVSRGVFPSDQSGEAAGVMVWGRYLNETRIQQFAEQTKLDLTIYPFDRTASHLDAEAQRQTALTPNSPTLIHVLNKDTIQGYALLNTFNANPALILKIERPRTIYKQGVRTLKLLIL